MNVPPPAAAPINPYSIKLGAFNPRDVKTWLAMSELHTSQLDAFGKYVVVSRHLPEDITAQIADLVATHSAPVVAPAVPDWEANYAELRTALLSRFTESDSVALTRCFPTRPSGTAAHPSTYATSRVSSGGARVLTVPRSFATGFSKRCPITYGHTSLST